MSNIVAIVGRPNVGKSTLFNRLIQKQSAIVDNESGVTRDRHYAKTDWNGVSFSLVDTGGYTQSNEDTFQKEIKRHVNSAIEESTLILFIVDVKSGITDLDFFLAKILKKVTKKVLLVVNKVDDGLHLSDSTVFFRLGFGDYFSIFAADCAAPFRKESSISPESFNIAPINLITPVNCSLLIS